MNHPTLHHTQHSQDALYLKENLARMNQHQNLYQQPQKPQYFQESSSTKEDSLDGGNSPRGEELVSNPDSPSLHMQAPDLFDYFGRDLFSDFHPSMMGEFGPTFTNFDSSLTDGNGNTVSKVQRTTESCTLAGQPISKTYKAQMAVGNVSNMQGVEKASKLVEVYYDSEKQEEIRATECLVDGKGIREIEVISQNQSGELQKQHRVLYTGMQENQSAEFLKVWSSISSDLKLEIDEDEMTGLRAGVCSQSQQ